MTDTIVYIATTKSGGIDGRDHTDRGGKVMAASINPDSIPTAYHQQGWYTIEPVVRDLEKVAETALRKLDPIERLALVKHFDTAIKRVQR